MKTTFIRTDKKNKRHLKLHSFSETVNAITGDDLIVALPEYRS